MLTASSVTINRSRYKAVWRRQQEEHGPGPHAYGNVCNYSIPSASTRSCEEPNHMPLTSGFRYAQLEVTQMLQKGAL
jgi:hypothetical protein